MIRFFLALLLLLPVLIPAQGTNIRDYAEANQLFDSANDRFAKGEPEQALEIYQRLLRSGYDTPAVLGNAGTAAHRAGAVGMAVLYYKRALRADPNYDRAISSLRQIEPQSNKAPDESVLGTFFRWLFRVTAPMLWIVAAELFLLTASFSLWMALHSGNPERRGHWLAVMTYTMIVCAVCGGLAFGNWRMRSGGDDAVILQDKTVARSAPTESSAELLLLPAGTVVTLTEEPQRGYVRVRLADGSAGYVAVKELERI